MPQWSRQFPHKQGSSESVETRTVVFQTLKHIQVLHIGTIVGKDLAINKKTQKLETISLMGGGVKKQTKLGHFLEIKDF